MIRSLRWLWHLPGRAGCALSALSWVAQGLAPTAQPWAEEDLRSPGRSVPKQAGTTAATLHDHDPSEEV